jgi:ABC-type sulfate transport system permease component
MKLVKPIIASVTNPVIKGSERIANRPDSYISDVLQAIISIFLVVAVVYFIWHFVMSAYHMISSQGDPEKWKAAQKSILYAFVGLFLALSIFAVLSFVGNVTGVKGLIDLKLYWPSL